MASSPAAETESGCHRLTRWASCSLRASKTGGRCAHPSVPPRRWVGRLTDRADSMSGFFGLTLRYLQQQWEIDVASTDDDGHIFSRILHLLADERR